MLTIEDIIKSNDLEKLFVEALKEKKKRKVWSKSFMKNIRNFCPLTLDDISEEEVDENFIAELEKYGRFSLVKYLHGKRKKN